MFDDNDNNNNDDDNHNTNKTSHKCIYNNFFTFMH